jgi:ABC-2 type transport system permease protein
LSLYSATLRRDFRHQVSYRLQFVAQLGGLALTILSYWFLAKLIPGRQTALNTYGSDYFTFVLVGTGAATFFTVGVNGFADSLEREQNTGTLETLFVSPNHSWQLLLAGAIFPFIFAVFQMIFYMLVGVIFLGAHIYLPHLFLAVVVLLLSVTAFSSIGLVAAATLIHTKRAVVVVAIADIVFTLVGGVLYPISVLPGFLQWLAHILPITYGLDGVRQAVLSSPDWGAIGGDCLALGLFTALFVPLALWLFEFSVRRARIRGSLSQY